MESPFFVADVGRLEDGSFTLVELNDGGCAGLPEQIDLRRLYRRIFADLR